MSRGETPPHTVMDPLVLWLDTIEPHAVTGSRYCTVEGAADGLADEGFTFEPVQISRCLRYLRTMGLVEEPGRFFYSWRWLGSVEEYELRRRAPGNGVLGWAQDLPWTHPVRVRVREGV